MTERHQLKGSEVPTPKENRYRMDITPVIARIIDTQIDSTDKKLNFNKINKASYESRKAYHAGSTEDFDAQNAKWNKGLSTWIEKKIDNDSSNMEFMHALDSIGILFTKRYKTQVKEVMIEDFRQKYLGKKEDETNIGGFVEDIAKDCKDSEGNVNLDTLSKRLHSIKDMFIVFGTDKDINILVAEFTVAYGHLSQEEDTVNGTMQTVEKKKLEKIDSRAKARLAIIGIDEEEQEHSTAKDEDQIQADPEELNNLDDLPEPPEEKTQRTNDDVIEAVIVEETKRADQKATDGYETDKDIVDAELIPDRMHPNEPQLELDSKPYKEKETTEEDSNDISSTEKRKKRQQVLGRQERTRQINRVTSPSTRKTKDGYEESNDKETYPSIELASKEELNRIMNRLQIKDEDVRSKYRKDFEDHRKDNDVVVTRVFKGQDNKPMISFEPRKKTN